MPKVERSLDLSSRGRSILRMSMDEHLTSLLKELLSTRTILTPGSYSVSLGKIWISTGEGRSETSAILSFRISAPPSTDKQRAIARVFS